MAGPKESYSGPILECRNLCLSYFTRAGEIPAVIDFNMTLNQGESIGLVGESGCGKSTVAMAIMRYLGNNGSIVGGQVLYKGRDMAKLSPEELRQLRGNEIAMVYQEPMASLNPSRSEEHTSELQSLMRLSYAAFCLSKKTQNIQTNTYT